MAAALTARRRAAARPGRWAALLLASAAGIAAAPAAGRAQAAQALAPAEQAALARLCRQSAARPPSPLAVEIAAGALREHDAFGGHVIARDGRMLRFGAVEADAFADPAGGRLPAWRQVLRYWQTLGPVGDGPLRVRRFPGLADDPGAGGPADLQPLGALLDRLARSGLPAAEREALAQAAIRAAGADIPWSAAFVSHVVLAAGAPRSRFAAAIAHLDYVSEAARRSRDELAGSPSPALYRACDPRTTPMRPGDLLCLHRHPPSDLAALDVRADLFAALLPALARGERPVWNLHCDIVVGRDERRRTAGIVGGNVLQSVTRRELGTDRRGALRAARARPACPGDAPPGPLCRPDSAPWFALLQLADD